MVEIAAVIAENKRKEQEKEKKRLEKEKQRREELLGPITGPVVTSRMR